MDYREFNAEVVSRVTTHLKVLLMASEEVVSALPLPPIKSRQRKIVELCDMILSKLGERELDRSLSMEVDVLLTQAEMLLKKNRIHARKIKNTSNQEKKVYYLDYDLPRKLLN